MAHIYSDGDASRALWRHERRTPGERFRLLTKLLCSAASDRDAIFEGTDPETGRVFHGPVMRYYAIETLAYFLACADRVRGKPPSTLRVNRIRHAVEQGIERARQHGAMEQRFDRIDRGRAADARSEPS